MSKTRLNKAKQSKKREQKEREKNIDSQDLEINSFVNLNELREATTFIDKVNCNLQSETRLFSFT